MAIDNISEWPYSCAIAVGCSYEGIEFHLGNSGLSALATMHARWWNSPRLNRYSWLVNPGDPSYAKRQSDSFVNSVEPAFLRLGDYAPDGLKEIADRLALRVPEVLREFGRTPITLIHGDFRLANLFFDDTTKSTTLFAVDWQLPQPCKAANDVARFMLSSVSPEHRSDYENKLLSEYHRALRNHGVNEYSYDEFMHDYPKSRVAIKRRLDQVRRWATLAPTVREATAGNRRSGLRKGYPRLTLAAILDKFSLDFSACLERPQNRTIRPPKLYGLPQ